MSLRTARALRDSVSKVTIIKKGIQVSSKLWELAFSSVLEETVVQLPYKDDGPSKGKQSWCTPGSLLLSAQLKGEARPGPHSHCPDTVLHSG